jgi:hypothetical protein
MILRLSAGILVPGIVQATMLIAFVTDDSCVIGADGISVGLTGKVGTMCKITVARSCIFAASGLVSESGTNFNFDVDGVVRQICDRPGSLAEFAAEFDSVIRKPLQRAVTLVETHHPMSYNQMLKGRPVLELMLVSPTISDVRVIVLSYAYVAGTVKLQKTVRLPEPSGSNLLVCGEKEAIRSFLNRPPPAAKHMNPVQLVTELLETSIEAHPNLVGRPLALLVVDKHGLRWLNHGACPR